MFLLYQVLTSLISVRVLDQVMTSLISVGLLEQILTLVCFVWFFILRNDTSLIMRVFYIR